MDFNLNITKKTNTKHSQVLKLNFKLKSVMTQDKAEPGAP